jgi:hypothetical protein
MKFTDESLKMDNKSFYNAIVKEISEIKKKLVDKESIEKFVIEEKELMPLYTMLGKIAYIIENE